MALKQAALALGLAGCTPWPPADCQTPCGMQAWGASDCDGLAEAESMAVGGLGHLYDGLCTRLGLVSLSVRDAPGGAWLDAWGRKVAGLTWCDFALMEVAGSDFTTNAYFHEVAHIAQCPAQDVGHQSWARLRVWDSLAALYTKANQGGETAFLGGNP